MSTLRGRLPILISECLAQGIDIQFTKHLEEPVIVWRKMSQGGHIYLDKFLKGHHNDNARLIEQALLHILEDAP